MPGGIRCGVRERTRRGPLEVTTLAGRGELVPYRGGAVVRVLPCRLRIGDVDPAGRVERGIGDLHRDDLAAARVVYGERVRPGLAAVGRLREPDPRGSDDVELERLPRRDRAAATGVD